MNIEELIVNTGKHIQSSTRLSEVEKASMRGALQSHMLANPALSVRKSPSRASVISEPTSSARLSRIKKNPIMIIGTIIALMLSGGVSFAAESALPGDILYPVKVHVNEEVRAAVAIGAEADAKWEARRAERRLEEAEQLKAESRLNATATATLATGFESHSKAFAEEKAKAVVESEGKTEVNAELNADFEAKLRAHPSALIDVVGDSKVEERMDGSGSRSANMSADAYMDSIINTTLKGTINASATTASTGTIKAIVPDELYPVDPVRIDGDTSVQSNGTIEVDAGSVKVNESGSVKTGIDIGL